MYEVKLEWKTKIACSKDNAISFAVEELLEKLQHFYENQPTQHGTLHWTVTDITKKKPKP